MVVIQKAELGPRIFTVDARFFGGISILCGI